MFYSKNKPDALFSFCAQHPVRSDLRYVVLRYLAKIDGGFRVAGGVMDTRHTHNRWKDTHRPEVKPDLPDGDARHTPLNGGLLVTFSPTVTLKARLID